MNLLYTSTATCLMLLLPLYLPESGLSIAPLANGTPADAAVREWLDRTEAQLALLTAEERGNHAIVVSEYLLILGQYKTAFELCDGAAPPNSRREILIKLTDLLASQCRIADARYVVTLLKPTISLDSGVPAFLRTPPKPPAITSGQ